MHKIHENIITRNKKVLVKIECMTCGHVRWVQKFKVHKNLVCPSCNNLGSLFDRINERYSIDENRGCYIWNSSYTADGYALITYKKKKVRVAKAVLENKLGRPLKVGYETCHLCNNRGCIKPEHLYEGTHKQNGKDLAESGKLKGEKASNSKITQVQAKIIKDMISSGKSLISISKELNISIPTIEGIKRGTSWKWL